MCNSNYYSELKLITLLYYGFDDFNFAYLFNCFFN